MKPTERLLTIVRLLRGAVVGESTLIREQMGDVYDGTAGARKWRRDIRTLRDRGLIETDLRDGMARPNRTGIRLRVPAKPERLHLTRAEHMAINLARQTLRRDISTVSPFGTLSPNTASDEIDYVGRILRCLDDNEDEIELVQLAQWLQLSEDRVFELVDVLTKEGVVRNGLVTSVEFGYGNDEDDDQADDVLRPDTVRVLRGSDSRRPTRGHGMDELGFFPYSLAETNERLALIDEAMAAAGIDERLNTDDLRTAQNKLAEWQGSLAGQDRCPNSPED